MKLKNKTQLIKDIKNNYGYVGILEDGTWEFVGKDQKTYGNKEIIYKEERSPYDVDLTNEMARFLVNKIERRFNNELDKLEALKNSYNNEMIAETYEEEEDDFQLPDRKGNCSDKENLIYED